MKAGLSVRWMIGALAGMLACLAVQAYGVGVLFPQETSGAKVRMAGARALVHRNGMREDLILQVGFTGTASEFAWVVAVPNAPSVQFANAAIFEELGRICNPRIIPSGPAAKAPPKAAPPEPAPIQVQSFAVYPPTDPTGLTRWLRANHFTIPAASYAVLQDYVKRRWHFIAARVRMTPSDEARWMQPLWIAFYNERAALPARLSSLNEAPIPAQLFVVADVVTKAPGFTEVYNTDTPARTKFKLNEFPLFFRVVTRDCKLTELRGMLDSANTGEDITIVPKAKKAK